MMKESFPKLPKKRLAAKSVLNLVLLSEEAKRLLLNTSHLDDTFSLMVTRRPFTKNLTRFNRLFLALESQFKTHPRLLDSLSRRFFLKCDDIRREVTYLLGHKSLLLRKYSEVTQKRKIKQAFESLQICQDIDNLAKHHDLFSIYFRLDKSIRQLNQLMLSLQLQHPLPPSRQLILKYLTRCPMTHALCHHLKGVESLQILNCPELTDLNDFFSYAKQRDLRFTSIVIRATRLRAIPETLGYHSETLRKLNLDNNYITSIPSSLTALFKDLRISLPILLSKQRTVSLSSVLVSPRTAAQLAKHSQSCSPRTLMLFDLLVKPEVNLEESLSKLSLIENQAKDVSVKYTDDELESEKESSEAIKEMILEEEKDTRKEPKGKTTPRRRAKTLKRQLCLFK